MKVTVASYKTYHVNGPDGRETVGAVDAVFNLSALPPVLQENFLQRLQRIEVTLSYETARSLGFSHEYLTRMSARDAAALDAQPSHKQWSFAALRARARLLLHVLYHGARGHQMLTQVGGNKIRFACTKCNYTQEKS